MYEAALARGPRGQVGARPWPSPHRRHAASILHGTNNSQRRVKGLIAVLRYFGAAIAAVACGRLIVTLPHRIADRYGADAALSIVDASPELMPMHYTLVWHLRSGVDAAHRSGGRAGHQCALGVTAGTVAFVEGWRSLQSSRRFGRAGDVVADESLGLLDSALEVADGVHPRQVEADRHVRMVLRWW